MIVFIIHEPSNLDRLYSVTQVRLLVEFYRSLHTGEESYQLVTLKLMEAIIEACPSALLQLVVVFNDTNHLNSTTSLALLLSNFLSTISIATILFRFFQPKIELSICLRFLYHVAEIWFRLITFVSIFLAMKGYGFIFLFASIMWKSLHLQESFGLKWVIDVFMLSISDCFLEDNIFTIQSDIFETNLRLSLSSNPDDEECRARLYNIFCCPCYYLMSSKYYLWMMNLLDFIISVVLLYTVGHTVSSFRKKVLLILGLVSFSTKMIIQMDRNSEIKIINNLFVKVEKRMGFCLQYMDDNFFKSSIPSIPTETLNPLEGRREDEKKINIAQIPDSIELPKTKNEV